MNETNYVSEINGYKIKDDRLGNLDELNTTNKSSIVEAINEIDSTIKDTMVIFGDSWSVQNYPYVTDQSNMWYNIIGKQLNLNIKNYAVDGAGYAVTSNSFNSQVNTAISDSTLEKSRVKYIFVFGGYNDLNFGDTTETNYGNNIDFTIANIKNNFPTSQIIMIGCNTLDVIQRGINHPTISNLDITNAQIQKAKDLGVTFINATLFLYGYTYCINESNHPNESGQILLASCILSSLNGNNTLSYNNTSYKSYNINHDYTNVTQAVMTTIIKGSLMYLTFNIKLDVNFTGTLSFNAEPFTLLPYSVSPLIKEGNFNGTIIINGSQITANCNNLLANQTYEASFIINF